MFDIQRFVMLAISAPRLSSTSADASSPFDRPVIGVAIGVDNHFAFGPFSSMTSTTFKGSDFSSDMSGVVGRNKMSGIDGTGVLGIDGKGVMGSEVCVSGLEHGHGDDGRF